MENNNIKQIMKETVRGTIVIVAGSLWAATHKLEELLADTVRKNSK